MGQSSAIIWAGFVAPGQPLRDGAALIIAPIPCNHRIGEELQGNRTTQRFVRLFGHLRVEDRGIGREERHVQKVSPARYQVSFPTTETQLQGDIGERLLES